MMLLAIVKESDSLTAAICENGLVKSRLIAAFRQPCAAGCSLAAALQSLKKICGDSGYAKAWAGKALICLPAEDAVFHDFQLPTKSLSRARKTVPLLLESEFPLELSGFARETVFYKNTDRLCALTTLLAKRILCEWQEALSACGLAGARIFIAPWPILGWLGKRKKAAVLAVIAGANVTVSAINASGQVLRVQQMFLKPGAGVAVQAENIHARARMLLEGLAFQPEEVLLYGQGSAFKSALGQEFQLPAYLAGEDFALAGNFARLGENDPTRLIALGMARAALLPLVRWPAFSLAPAEKAGRQNRARYLLPAAGAAILLFCAGLSVLISAMDSRSKADYLRGLALAEMRRALPDAPKNASAGRLRATLKSRIAAMESGSHAETSQIILKMLSDIHAAVPQNLKIDVHRLSVDGRHARIYGRAGSFDDVNAMKEKLGAIDGLGGCRIVNAANRSDREHAYVEFELDLPRQKP